MNPRHDFVKQVGSIALEVMASNPDCVNGLHLSLGSGEMRIHFCWAENGQLRVSSLYVSETEVALLTRPDLILRRKCIHKVEELRRDKARNL